jgi:hypothetical protein
MLKETMKLIYSLVAAEETRASERERARLHNFFLYSCHELYISLCAALTRKSLRFPPSPSQRSRAGRSLAIVCFKIFGNQMKGAVEREL